MMLSDEELLKLCDEVISELSAGAFVYSKPAVIARALKDRLTKPTAIHELMRQPVTDVRTQEEERKRQHAIEAFIKEHFTSQPSPPSPAVPDDAGVLIDKNWPEECEAKYQRIRKRYLKDDALSHDQAADYGWVFECLEKLRKLCASPAPAVTEDDLAAVLYPFVAAKDAHGTKLPLIDARVQKRGRYQTYALPMAKALIASGLLGGVRAKWNPSRQEIGQLLADNIKSMSDKEMGRATNAIYNCLYAPPQQAEVE